MRYAVGIMDRGVEWPLRSFGMLQEGPHDPPYAPELPHHAWCRGGGWGWVSVVYASKLEADEAIAVASVIPIDRAKNMRAGEVIGLEYLEHERRT